MDVTRECISRISEMKEITCHSKLVSTLSMVLLSVIEILSGIVQTTAAFSRLKPVWNNGSISLSSKILEDSWG